MPEGQLELADDISENQENLYVQEIQDLQSDNRDLNEQVHYLNEEIQLLKAN